MTANRKDFLLEIGVEELPARFLDPALKELEESAGKVLKEQRLSYEEIKTYGAPRRMALLVKGLAENQETLQKEVKGPALKSAYNQDGSPSKALLGFSKSQGVGIGDLVKKTVNNVDYMFAVKQQSGLAAMDVLQELAPVLIAGLHFPKPMRWGDLDIRFARPIRWIVALLGESVVEFAFAGCDAGRISAGHRFLAKEPVQLADASQYVDKMREAFVMVDQEGRREIILEQVREQATLADGQVEPDDELLREVNNLVEYPTAFTGDFSEEYLKLPKEVLVTLMREHQRYFPIVSTDGSLLPKFIAVRNGDTMHLDTVRAGNEKVLRARLADADFFFREDLKTPLADKVPGLGKIVFQETLGTIYDKVTRLDSLVEYLAGVLGADEVALKQAKRGAYLAKADLVTNMVYEFPELQGSMGREYAARSGEEPEVAAAVFEHYQPRFAGDDLPETLPGKILSIADKIDNITGSFAIGIRPSGSQDPYALRRQALGISHILLSGNIDISLKALVAAAYRGYEGKVQLKVSKPKVADEVVEFFGQRFKGVLEERGFAYDTIDAVLSVGFDNINETLLRAEALTGLRPNPSFNDLLSTFVRANNLAKNATGAEVDPALLSDESEQDLYRRLQEVTSKSAGLLAAKDYHSMLAAVATLQEPIARFFDDVMVMVEDEKVRANRLALLRDLASLVKQVADLSKIAGDSKT
ncbi:MAG: glycine--tRNA ligase subunit beta [Peptococcaceae bacterium]|nr:glycine--tRNA ligase subunit beta [Peptococcaceae bacterium]